MRCCPMKTHKLRNYDGLCCWFFNMTPMTLKYYSTVKFPSCPIVKVRVQMNPFQFTERREVTCIDAK